MGDVRVKFIDWFSGIGGFRRGMELAGHECVGFCEFDKFATASYISMHLLTDEQRKKLNELPQKKRQKEILKDEYRNGEWYANDVRRVCADDIPKADCWCFGFPCFAKGTYILTEKGYIPIEDVSVCLVLMEDGISPDCSLKWSSVGMMQNGRCSTPRISECHKTEKGASLSDILEAEVPQKYFLSKEQTEKIVFR